MDDRRHAEGLPAPDYVIGDVGTTLYRVGPDYLWELEHAWEHRIAADWSGHIASIACSRFAARSGLVTKKSSRAADFLLVSASATLRSPTS